MAGAHCLVPLWPSPACPAQIRLCHSIRSLAQTPAGVSAVVDAASGSPAGPGSSGGSNNGSSSGGGTGGIYRLSGQYLAACDGARGSLRQQLGVGMGGPGAIQHLINIHFVSPQVGGRVGRSAVEACRLPGVGGPRAWAVRAA